MLKNREYLITLDGVAGDSDLGLTIADGFRAAANYAANFSGDDIGNLFYYEAKRFWTRHLPAWAHCWGAGMLQCGKTLKGCKHLAIEGIYEMLRAVEEGVIARDKAQVGEKHFWMVGTRISGGLFAGAKPVRHPCWIDRKPASPKRWEAGFSCADGEAHSDKQYLGHRCQATVPALIEFFQRGFAQPCVRLMYLTFDDTRLGQVKLCNQPITVCAAVR